MLTPGEAAAAQVFSQKRALDRIAACSWPIRLIFKSRATQGSGGGTGAGRGGAGRGDAPPAATAPGTPPPARGNGGVAGGTGGFTPAQMKEKYGEITMLDFPQFSKDTFPGVTHMDIFSGLTCPSLRASLVHESEGS